MPKTKAQNLYDRIATPKRNHNALRFPSDIDTDGTQNIIRFNISLPVGSKYLSNGQYQKAIDPSTGQARTSDFRSRQSRASLARRFSDNYVRIQTTIDLYMPPQVQSSYQSNWNVSELGALGAGIDAFQGIMNYDSFADAMNIWDVVKDVAPSAAYNTLAGTAQSLSPINAKDAKAIATSETANPYMEVIFNGIEHRTFSFTFKMIPRNSQEQETVRRIVKEFKFHRAPEYKSEKQNVYMRFPSEFDISFIHKNAENPWLFKISTCALTNVEINHSPEGQYAAHSDGSPFATEMTLSFTEMELLSKERIEDGY